MALFLLVTQRTPTSTGLLDRLPVLYPDHKAIAPNAWLIHTEGTSRDISEHLFPRDDKPQIKSHVVVLVNGYFGWNERTLWEWMSAATKAKEG